MYRAFICLSLFALLFESKATMRPELVSVSLAKAYIPIGFDNNDQTQLVVAGSFPNTCFQVGPYHFKVDEDTHEILIYQQAFLYQGVCMQVNVPFYQVIDTKMLGRGNYKIVDGYGGTTLGQLPIEEATSPGPGTDEFPYAPVTDAFVVNESQSTTLVLQGTFTNRCMKLRKVDLRYQEDVVVVLPIVELLDGDINTCTSGQFRFEKRIKLKELQEHAYLIHIRSMSGKALNRIYSGETN